MTTNSKLLTVVLVLTIVILASVLVFFIIPKATQPGVEAVKNAATEVGEKTSQMTRPMVYQNELAASPSVKNYLASVGASSISYEITDYKLLDTNNDGVQEEFARGNIRYTDRDGITHTFQLQMYQLPDGKIIHAFAGSLDDKESVTIRDP